MSDQSSVMSVIICFLWGGTQGQGFTENLKQEYVDWHTDRQTDRQTEWEIKREKVHFSFLLLNFYPLVWWIEFEFGSLTANTNWLSLGTGSVHQTKLVPRSATMTLRNRYDFMNESYQDETQRKWPWVQFIGLCPCITIGALACRSACGGEH